MPGDLRDPEQSATFHYDPRYLPGKNTFEEKEFDLDMYLQSIARQTVGGPLKEEDLKKLKKGLDLHQNYGSEGFRDDARKKIKVILTVKKALYNARSK